MVIIQFLWEITIVVILFIWQLLKECLYFLMHIAINLVVTIEHVYHRFWVRKSSPNGMESEIGVLMENIPRLNKPLNHLVVLVDTERHCMSDLARVVTWSLVARVPYVSFHDVTGNLKRDEEKLLREVERHKRELFRCTKYDSNDFRQLQSHTVVTVLGPEDGRPKISRVVRRIASERVRSPQNYKEITVQELNSRLSLVYSFPDPDLILYTGPSCCVHGLLPWQIRLSEFIRLSIDHSFTVPSFVGALYKYNKCDQRFGK